MRNLKFYFKLIWIRILGTKENKADVRLLGEIHDRMMKEYMEQNGLTNKRKAAKQLNKELRQLVQTVKKRTRRTAEFMEITMCHTAPVIYKGSVTHRYVTRKDFKIRTFLI